MNYKQLQSALKSLRNSGITVNVKLNAKATVLQAEYNRIMATPAAEPAVVEPTVDYSNEIEQLRQELATERQLHKITLDTVAALEDTIETLKRRIVDIGKQAPDYSDSEQAFADLYTSDNDTQMAVAYYRLENTAMVDELNLLYCDWKQVLKDETQAKVVEILRKHNATDADLDAAVAKEKPKQQAEAPKQDPEQARRQTIDWDDVFKRLHEQHAEQWAQWEREWEEYRNSTGYTPSVKTDNTYADEARTKLHSEGKKATLRWLTSLKIQQHPDTCKQHGNTYNERTWLMLMDLTDAVKNDTL